MKLFRLRFILLGLLLCVCHVWSLICGTEFTDPASGAYMADIVIVGTLSQKLPPNQQNNRYNATIRARTKKNILKGFNYIRRVAGRRGSGLLTVGEFGDTNNETCVFPIVRDTKYVFLLNRTSDRRYFKLSAKPVQLKTKRDLKKTKKLIKKIVCKKPPCVRSPEIDKTKMQNKSIQFGKPLELNCKLKKRMSVVPIYKWYKDGVEIKASKKLQIRNHKRGSKLRKRKANISDGGTYRCVVESVAGEANQESVITIGVSKPKPPGKVMKDKAQKFGGTLKLTCRIKDGALPKATFTWYKDGKEIRTGTKPGLSIRTRGNESKLRKAEVHESDAGRYMCTVRNAGGVVNQTSVITVTGVPKLPKGNKAPKKVRDCDPADKNYCLNNGTCQVLVEIDRKYCTCRPGYRGERCLELIFNLDKIREDKLAHDRNLIIVGIISGILLFIGICVASYFLSRRRRQQFLRRQSQPANGDPHDIPPRYRPLRGSDDIDGLNHLKRKSGTTHQETQTIETCFIAANKDNIEVSPYINPAEGYMRPGERNSKARKAAVSLEGDPRFELINHNKNSPNNRQSKSSVGDHNQFNNNSRPGSMSNDSPRRTVNDTNPIQVSDGFDNDRQPGANHHVSRYPQPVSPKATEPPAFNLESDSDEENPSDNSPLTPLHISEDEFHADTGGRKPRSNRNSATSVDKRIEPFRTNAKESNVGSERSQPRSKDQFKSNDRHDSPSEKLYASNSSSGYSDSDSSSTTEGCDSPNTARQNAFEGVEGWNEHGSPEHAKIPLYKRPNFPMYPHATGKTFGKSGNTREENRNRKVKSKGRGEAAISI